MKNFEDLMLDETFITLMNKEGKDINEWKQRLILDDPDSVNEFEKACILHSAFSIHKKFRIDDKEKTKALRSLQYKIDAFDKTKNNKVKTSIRYWKSIAATAVLFIAISIPALLYTLEKTDQKISYNEILVPSGEKASVRLPDGTMVWLNSESKLIYPASFGRNNREVMLEGEGYFEVTTKKRNFFTVITKDIKIIALGTIFNVKSYPEDDVIETTLVEGSVKLKPPGNIELFEDITLKPNEKAIYKHNEKGTEKLAVHDNITNKTDIVEDKLPQFTPQLISINRVNTNNIVCWKDHLLIFENETLDEISVKMSRWYKIQVEIIDDELKGQRFTGKFINNETYLQVLEAINLTTPIKYELLHNHIYIKQQD